jgi:hypothetical protein
VSSTLKVCSAPLEVDECCHTGTIDIACFRSTSDNLGHGSKDIVEPLTRSLLDMAGQLGPFEQPNQGRVMDVWKPLLRLSWSR